jgi:hypothetical protein
MGAIVHGRTEALVDLSTQRTRGIVGAEVLISILAGTRVAPFCICTDSMLVTIVTQPICALIRIDALAFPVA